MTTRSCRLFLGFGDRWRDAAWASGTRRTMSLEMRAVTRSRSSIHDHRKEVYPSTSALTREQEAFGPRNSPRSTPIPIPVSLAPNLGDKSG